MQAAWALGNIIGDNKEFRDQVLYYDVVTPLFSIWQPLNHPDSTSAKHVAVWTYANLCRYRSADWSKV